MLLLDFFWHYFGLLIIFACAVHLMLGGRVHFRGLFSAAIKALTAVVRAVFAACGQVGAAVAPGNPLLAMIVQIALIAALVAVLLTIGVRPL